MKNVVHLPAAPRDVDIQQLIDLLPLCVAATVAEVGVAGLQQFFDGYKQTMDEVKKAA